MEAENAKKVLEEERHQLGLYLQHDEMRVVNGDRFERMVEALNYALNLFDEVDRLKEEVQWCYKTIESSDGCVNELRRLKSRVGDLEKQEHIFYESCQTILELQAENDRLKAEIKMLEDDEKDCEDCPELDRMSQEIARLKGRVGDLEKEKTQIQNNLATALYEKVQLIQDRRNDRR